MGETKLYTFSYKEIAEMLVKQQGIHSGLWGVYIRFGIGAANVGDPENGLLVPSAIVPVREIGLQRFDEANNLTVDAAQVNPKGRASAKKTIAKAVKVSGRARSIA